MTHPSDPVLNDDPARNPAGDPADGTGAGDDTAVEPRSRGRDTSDELADFENEFHPAEGARPSGHPGVVLAVVAIAQLLIVLDATVVNIALPAAQADLGMSATASQWVVTGYALAFGALLLLGGRICDLLGAKRVFMSGMVGFAAASAVGGLAFNPEMLLAARLGQGVFAAMLAPAGLALLTNTFSGAARARAFAVYGAVAAAGSAFGLLVGGLLTEYLSWHWCLLINIPIALITLSLGRWALPGHTSSSPATAAPVPADDMAGHPGPERDNAAHDNAAHDNAGHHTPGQDLSDRGLDLTSAALATVGLASLVYGLTRAVEDSWTSALTIGLFAAATVGLVLFVLRQGRLRHPLLPLRILTQRDRAGALVAMAMIPAALIGVFFYLSFYLQQVRGYTPVETGVAFLPLSLGVVIAAGLASTLTTRVPPRWIITTGLVLAAGGIGSLYRLQIDTPYYQLALSQILVALGAGLVFVTATNLALYAVDEHDTGVASAVVNTGQQVGGALGLSIISTVVISQLNDSDAAAASPLLMLTDAYSAGFLIAAAFPLLGAVLTALLIRAPASALEGATQPVAH